MSDQRLDHDFDNRWHRALNDFNTVGENFHTWMYRAKEAADEVSRLALLFAKERSGALVQVHHQCSHDIEGTPVQDNHLTCCLGTACRECVFLLALDKMTGASEEIDRAKAWTCVTHILSESGKSLIDTSEGFILTTDDMMYWQNVYNSLSQAVDDDQDEREASGLMDRIRDNHGGSCPDCGSPLHIGAGTDFYNRTCPACHFHDFGPLTDKEKELP